MAFQSLPWAIQGATHPAPIARNQTAAAFGVPVAAHTAAVAATTAGGGHGIIDAGDLAVTQKGTPAMAVVVALGRAIIRSGAASSLLNGCYTVLNDAAVEVTIAASDPTNPRIDLIIIHQPDTNDGDASNVPLALAVTGTPAASPAVPALTAYKNCLVLAQIAVAAAATTIVTANITDKRTRAYALGGVCVCTSTTRPTGGSLHAGLRIFETDTLRELTYDGTGWVIMSEPTQVYTPAVTQNGARTSTVTRATYRRNDGWVTGMVRLTITNAGTSGNRIGVSLPVSAEYTASDQAAGSFVYYRVAGARYVGLTDVNVALVSGFCFAVNAGTDVAGIDPAFATANGDVVAFNFCYQMATRYS